jgi:hypothetical protein
MVSTRSSSTKKNQTVPDTQGVLEDVTAETVPSNTATVDEIVVPSNAADAAETNKTDTVTSTNRVVLEGDNEEDERVVEEGRHSILVAVEKHKEEPLMIYWDSKEAKNLFRPVGEETVLEAIENQIQLLVGAFNGNNWKSIVDPTADLHKEFYLVPGSVADLKEQAMALSVALDLAKRDKPSKTWAVCCEEAVKLIYGNDNLIATPSPPSSAKLQEWYREFREHRFFLSKSKRKQLQKAKNDENMRLKKELSAAKKQNAALLSKIESGLGKVKSSKEAADLLAEIELDMTKIKIKD